MKMRNIYSQQCWAAGDSDNDIEMLKMFKNSCFVAWNMEQS